MKQDKGDNKFRVVRNVYYSLDQQKDEAVYTYEIQFKRIGKNEFTVELSNFFYRDTAKDSLVDSTVRNLLEEYQSVFFPVLLDIKEDVCFIKNKEIIIERIENKNRELRLDSKYLIDSDTAKNKNISRYHVIDDMKKFFLKNATNDYIMEDTCSKGMMEVLLFSLGKIKNDNNYDLKFNLSPFNSKVNWECKKISEDDRNVVKYIGEIKRSKKLFKELKRYQKLEGSFLNTIKSETPIHSILNHAVHFDPVKSSFDFFEMDIIVKHDFYDYKETIYISAINQKELTNE